jgi:hypothetical protein
MADPADKVTGVVLHRITEGILSVDNDPVVNLETEGAEKIELVNKGPNTVYFRADGTTPTAQASGNGDQIASGGRVTIEKAKITDVKFLCHTAETATVFYRLYS